MPRKSRSRQGLRRAARLGDARRWLAARLPADLLSAYCQRYGVVEPVAYEEIERLGFVDALRIQGYERRGIEWERRRDAIEGTMKIVPRGTPDEDLHRY